MSLDLINVNKYFGQHHVIDNVNFSVAEGAVFGFLGPNGAGKTTTMRMMLDIIRPDTGQITWKGEEMSLEKSHKFGYLPEERGLYPKMVVKEQMRFFARLKGLSAQDAEREIDYWIERFQLGDLVTKRASELSKGNQQKVQFILAILNRPQLLILDEPFSGLDPVNVELLKKAFLDLAHDGKTILFSSHRMEHVEELCDSLCLIKEGRIIVQGTVDSVKRATGRKIIHLAVNGSLDFLARFGVQAQIAERFDEQKKAEMQMTEFDLPAQTDPQEILKDAMAAGTVERFEVGDPSLNDVFISLVGGGEQ